MSVYRLTHGQFGYTGHALNLPQDVTSFLNSLPRCPSTLDVILVRKEGSADSHKDFRVRRSVVLRALQWLIVNSKYYHDVTINHDILVYVIEWQAVLFGINSASSVNRKELNSARRTRALLPSYLQCENYLSQILQPAVLLQINLISIVTVA